MEFGTEDFFRNLQEFWPNIPILHWWRNKDRKVSNNCWKIPNILDLHYSNTYWQVKRTSEGIFYLYAAYYDVRKVPMAPKTLINLCIFISIYINPTGYFEVNEPKLRPGVPGPSVRILGMIDRLEPKVNLSCSIYIGRK